ncbi:hypothetical protein KDU71_07410 [Carboxylicivirga sediminis]|uniref:Tape measure protein N-terminal domain-containing protein n=1 Tax=Carboxylicivirga sediminis TaxID=2006564 RepID=A0A941F246_9BACT|nr:tape measure protein [Carboxylicivirga sediminis]MBR8535383.1 hypothetical protein [Carboxylicivirga sediminis]
MPLNNREGALYFATGIDTRGLASGARRSEQIIQGISQTAVREGEEMNKVFRRLGAAMAGYFTLTSSKQFISDIVRVRGEFQQLDIAFQTMLGNKEQADRLMAQVVDFATRTPFQLTEVATGTKQLLAVGVEAEKALPTLKALGDVAAGLSVPLERLIINFGQVRTQTTLTSRELRDFNMAGVPLVAELSKNLGQSEKAIKEMVSAGEIGFADVEAAFISMSEEGGRFANLMDKQMGSVTGQVSLFQDAWNRMLNSIGKANEGTIFKTIKSLTNAVENYEEIIDVLKVIVATYGTYKTALISVAVAQKAVNAAQNAKAWLQLASGIRSAKDAQIAFNLASKSNPYGLIAAGIAAIVATLLIFNREGKKAASVSAEFKENLAKERDSIQKDFSVLDKVTKGTVAHKLAISKLNDKYSEYLPNLLTEKEALEDVKAAQEAVIEARAKSLIQEYSDDNIIAAQDKVKKLNQEYKEALGDIFNRADIEGELEGVLIARFDKVIEGIQEGRISGIATTADLFKKIFKDEGFQPRIDIKEGEFMTLANYSLDIAEAKNEEADATKRAEDALVGYLKALGILKKESTNDEGENDSAVQFDAKKYSDDLKAKYDEYAKYENAKFQLGKKFADKQFATLLSQGASYEEYLNRQLQLFSNNEEAKIGIAQAANKAGISLLLREDMKKLAPTTKVDVSKEFEIDTKTLKSMDKLIHKWEWLAKVMNTAFKEEKQVEFGHKLADSGALLQEMAQTAGHFDENLSRALGTMGNLAASIGTAVANWGENPLMAGAGIVGAVGSLVSLFDNSAKKQQIAADKAQALLDIIQLQNLELERQLRLMGELTGTERTESETETLNIIQEQIDELNQLAKDADIKFKKGDLSAKFDLADDVESLEWILSHLDEINNPFYGSNFTSIGLSETLKDLLGKGFKIENLDQLQEFIDKYYELIEQRNKLFEEFTQTNENAIADSIIEGFRTGKTAMEDFTGTFEDLMKEALLESFKKQFVLQAVKDFYTAFGEAVNPEDGEGLTADEIKALKEMWDNSTSQLKEQFEAFDQMTKEIFGTSIFGEGGSESSGLAGAIKRELTEETGSMLAGLFNIMSVDVRALLTSYQTNAATQANMMMQTITILNEIEENTGRTADNTDRLEKIETILSDIRDGNTSTTGKR